MRRSLLRAPALIVCALWVAPGNAAPGAVETGIGGATPQMIAPATRTAAWPVIHAGESVTGRMEGAGAAMRVLFEAVTTGPIVIEARSFSVDVRLAVRAEPVAEDAAGDSAGDSARDSPGSSAGNFDASPLAEADEGLPGSDARVALTVSAGHRYRIEVLRTDVREDTSGDVTVTVVAGEPPAPPAAAGQEAADEAYWNEALSRGDAACDPRLQVRALLGRMRFRYAQGRFAEAVEEARRAQALAISAFGPASALAGVATGELGTMLYAAGDYPGAHQELLRAIPILELAYGPEDETVSTSLGTLGLVLEELDDLAGARDALMRSVAIRERIHGPDAAETANILNNLASVYDDMGRLEESLGLYRRVLAIFTAKLGPEARRTTTACNNVGYALRRLGRPAEGLKYYEQALAIREKLLDASHPLLALSLQNVGVARFEMGDCAKAEELMRRALAIREERLGSDHPDVAITLGNLAQALYAEGRTEEALELSTRALSIATMRFGPETEAAAKQLAWRAPLLLASGRPAEALDAALRAESIGREALRVTARFLPERHALSLSAARTHGLDVALTTLERTWRAQPEGIARCWSQLTRSRALVLDEMARRRRAQTTLALAGSGPAQAAAIRLATAVGEYARLVSGTGTAPQGGFPAALASARQEKEAAETVLAGLSADYRDEMQFSAAGIEETRAALPAGTALVAFVRYRTTLGVAVKTAAHYAAFVAPPEGAPLFIPLGDAAALDALIMRWRGLVTSGASGDQARAVAAERLARRAGTELRTRLWDPVQAATGAARVVFVIPDGVVNLVPFSALPASGGGYLVEREPTLHILSSEREICELAAPPMATEPPKIPLLVLGGPAFDAAGAPAVWMEPVSDATLFRGGPEHAGAPASANAAQRGKVATCGLFRDWKFEALPQSAREAEEVAALAPGARLLLGAQASETSFKQLAPQSAMVHLATHGFVLDERCGNGDLPLQMSGLALAGANLRAGTPAGQDDGVLTSEEIAALDLSRVRWVALSACDTGTGGIAAGEGVLGLRRAFAIAGARTLLLTLWPVADGDARALMKALYRERFSKGRPAYAALRQASLTLLRDRRARGLDTNPLHWGGYTSSGDWR